MRAIDLCNILERNYKEGEFQCDMGACGSEPCDLCTVHKFENAIRADIVEEVSMHLMEAGYTYDSSMGIGDNIGSALLKEYANGYKKGEQDCGADAIRKFAKWLINNYLVVGEQPEYTTNEILAEYVKAQKND